MTAPSALLDAVVATLETRIGTRAVEVRSSDGDFLASGGKEKATVRSPGLLVTILGMPQEFGVDVGPGIHYALFAVACHAKSPDPDDGRNAAKVAMDLAAFVMAIARTERWRDGDGVAQAKGRAERIRATNEYDRDLHNAGMRLWLVTWIQPVELDTALGAPTLAALASITHTFAMGDEGVGPPNDDPQSTTVFP